MPVCRRARAHDWPGDDVPAMHRGGLKRVSAVMREPVGVDELDLFSALRKVREGRVRHSRPNSEVDWSPPD